VRKKLTQMILIVVSMIDDILHTIMITKPYHIKRAWLEERQIKKNEVLLKKPKEIKKEKVKIFLFD